MERNNFSPEETYRKELAEKIISEPDLESRQKVLARAQESREYWQARLYEVIKRRGGEGLGTERALAAVKLLQEHRETEHPAGEKLKFVLDENKDVYNISSPFEIEGIQYIVGRIEDRKEIASSKSGFFVEKNGEWVLDETKPTFALEDPFLLKIQDEIIFGGIQTWKDENQKLNWRTVFYRGNSLEDLREFAASPAGMKDVRLIDLEDGRIGVFTRPQGSVAAKGKIGYTEMSSLDELTPAKMINARILEDRFLPNEWGGVNQAHLLENGDIGIIGHIAAKDDLSDKHYYATSLIFNPRDFNIRDLKVIATREDFPEGEMKVPDPNKPNELADVIFAGGITRNEDGTATLYCGLSDTEAGKITIEDPFKE